MIETLSPLIKKFLPFAQEQMGFDKPPKLFLKGDPGNAEDPLGRTAFYDPSSKSITIYITDRHPKDVMRSLSHELVHHSQNCRGQFSDASEMGEGYAQNDDHLREMEREAYEVGNMCFRDWEDSIKSTIYYEHLQKGENKMTIKDWKNKEISMLLSEAWGFKFNSLQEFDEFSGNGELQKEGEEELEEVAGVARQPRERRTPHGTGKRVEDDPKPEAKDDEEELEEVAGVARQPRERRQPHGTGKRVEDDPKPEAKDDAEESLDESEDTGASEDDDSKTHKGEKDYTTKKGKKLKTSGKGRGKKKGDEADINEEAEVEEPELEEIAAKRQGNEDRDVGKDRMHADRMHENSTNLNKEAIRSALREVLLSLQK
jgi:hypothetical protein